VGSRGAAAVRPDERSSDGDHFRDPRLASTAVTMRRASAMQLLALGGSWRKVWSA